MERREDIGEVLRGERPAMARVPSDLRARIDGAIGEGGPGRERVPGEPRRALAGALIVALAGSAVWVGLGSFGSQSAAPIEPPGPVAQETPALLELGSMRAVSLNRVDPLTHEARMIWSDVQRFRATIEGPVRTMTDFGKSL